MITAAQRSIKPETLSAIIKMIKMALCLHLFVQNSLCLWNYDGYLLAMLVYTYCYIYAFVQVRKGGLGGYCWAELLHWDMSLYLPLSSKTGTATCPNCKEDERIKELEFGCDCNEKISALTASIFGAFWITPHANTQEIMKNQTLVDWLVVSGGIHFEPDWESKNEMKIEESEKGWVERNVSVESHCGII